MSDDLLAVCPDADLSGLDPAHEARRGRRIEGGLRLTGLERLSGMIVDAASCEPARIALRFETDDEGGDRLVGRIEVAPRVVCQRCMEPMSIAMVLDVRLAVADRAGRVPGDCEPLPMDDGRCDIRTIVEDEIILALPIVAMHELDECGIDERYRGEILADPDAGTGERTRRPFSGLADLLAASAKKGD